MPLFEAVKLAERYDLAIMSTKGMSVTASRQLVEELCARHDIPLLLLHDFDKSRLLDRRNARSVTPAAIPSSGTSRSTTSGCGWRTSTGSRPRK